MMPTKPLELAVWEPAWSIEFAGLASLIVPQWPLSGALVPWAHRWSREPPERAAYWRFCDLVAIR